MKRNESNFVCFDEDEMAPLCNRKKFLPLFVREFLMTNSVGKRKFRQEEILNVLDEYPYSITVERKALSRAINTLIQEFPYICKGADGSVWFDKDKLPK